MSTSIGTGAPDVPRRSSRSDSGKVQEASVTATSEAGGVMGTAKDKAGEVAGEVGTQARNLVGDLRTQLRDQSYTQRDRLAGSLRQVGDDLDKMAQSTGSGFAADVTSQLATRARDASTFLSEHDPGDLLENVRQFARRRPGMFLLVAAAAGIVTGRLTRAMASRDSSGTPDQPDRFTASRPAPSARTYATESPDAPLLSGVDRP